MLIKRPDMLAQGRRLLAETGLALLHSVPRILPPGQLDGCGLQVGHRHSQVEGVGDCTYPSSPLEKQLEVCVLEK